MNKLNISSIIMSLFVLLPQIGAAALNRGACAAALVAKGIAKGYGEKTNLSAANRLLVVLDSMLDAERDAFLKSIDEKELHQIAVQLQSGQRTTRSKA